MNEAALTSGGLVVLLDRTGGKASYTEAEYQVIAARFGGTTNLAVHIEVVREGEAEPRVELALIRKALANAETRDVAARTEAVGRSS
jgi:hypothetical protein